MRGTARSWSKAARPMLTVRSTSWLIVDPFLRVHQCPSVVKVLASKFVPSETRRRRPGSTRARPAFALHITIEWSMTSDGRFGGARGAAGADVRARRGGMLLRRPRGNPACSPWRSSENYRGDRSSVEGDTHDRASRRSSRLPGHRENQRGIRGQIGARSGFGIRGCRVNVRATRHGANRLSARRSDRSPSVAPTCQVVKFLSPTRRLTSYAGGATRSDPLRCVQQTLCDPPVES